MPETPEKLLQDGLKKLGFEPKTEIIRSFMVYLSELKRWGRAYNLTAIKREEDIIIKHFLDSALYLLIIEEKASKMGLNGPFAIADVGSGAGFPGLPMKILKPVIKVFLIEPSRKKTAFLRYLINKLALNDIEVIEKRVEDVSDINIDVAVTRALYKPAEFVKKTSHIVKKSGFFVLSKGPNEKTTEEIEGIEVKEFDLPFTDIKRAFFVINR